METAVDFGFGDVGVTVEFCNFSGICNLPRKICPRAAALDS
jgi:hypothetical protein